MDYRAAVRFLHPGSAPLNLRPAYAALASGLVMVAAACGGDESPAGSSPSPPDGDRVRPMPTSRTGSPAPAITVLPTSSPAALIEQASEPISTPTETPPRAPASTAQRPSPDATVRPADPSRPASTGVSWLNGDAFVGGTITIPAGADAGNPLPAVLLVAGAGGADRDWVSPSIPGINGSGRLLAAVIAEEGYVTLQYDSRGTGRRFEETAPSPGENRLGDSVGEVASAIEFLATRPEVDPQRIFLVAHDEGALYVLLREQQASGPAVAGIALLAPSGLTLRQQVIRRLGELTTGPQDEPLLGRFDAAMAFFIAGTLLPDEDLGFSPSLQALFDNLSHPLNQPYVSEVWNLDIVSLLPETVPPVLVLIGQADSESDWLVDGGAWEDAAAAGQDVQFSYPALADHVLKSVSSDSESAAVVSGPAAYNAFGRTLDAETVAVLTGWLNDRSGASAP